MLQLKVRACSDLVYLGATSFLKSPRYVRDINAQEPRLVLRAILDDNAALPARPMKAFALKAPWTRGGTTRTRNSCSASPRRRTGSFASTSSAGSPFPGSAFSPWSIQRRRSTPQRAGQRLRRLPRRHSHEQRGPGGFCASPGQQRHRGGQPCLRGRPGHRARRDDGKGHRGAVLSCRRRKPDRSRIGRGHRRPGGASAPWCSATFPWAASSWATRRDSYGR